MRGVAMAADVEGVAAKVIGQRPRQRQVRPAAEAVGVQDEQCARATAAEVMQREFRAAAGLYKVYHAHDVPNKRKNDVLRITVMLLSRAGLALLLHCVAEAECLRCNSWQVAAVVMVLDPDFTGL